MSKFFFVRLRYSEIYVFHSTVNPDGTRRETPLYLVKDLLYAFIREYLVSVPKITPLDLEITTINGKVLNENLRLHYFLSTENNPFIIRIKNKYYPMFSVVCKIPCILTRSPFNSYAGLVQRYSE
jgi:hypothetical protein